MTEVVLFLFCFVLFSVLSITCYRCGGVAPSGECSNSNNATVECAHSSMANAVFACKVYTVNYTTLNRVLDFKSKDSIEKRREHYVKSTVNKFVMYLCTYEGVGVGVLDSQLKIRPLLSYQLIKLDFS